MNNNIVTDISDSDIVVTNSGDIIAITPDKITYADLVKKKKDKKEEKKEDKKEKENIEIIEKETKWKSRSHSLTRDSHSFPLERKFSINSGDFSDFKSFNSRNSHKKPISSFFGLGTGPREQFYTKAQQRRRLDSDNRKSQKHFYSAGILPFYVKNKTIHFLLGRDPDGKWSDFGGRSEGQDQGRWDMTAAREFYEETIGSVMDIPTILSRMQNKKNHIKVKGKTYSGSPYFMYVVRIPYKESYRQYFHSTLSFIKYTHDHQAKKSPFVDYKYFEKTDIQWISIETLKTSLETTENSEMINYPLKTVFKNTLEGHFDRINEFCNCFTGSFDFDLIKELPINNDKDSKEFMGLDVISQNSETDNHKSEKKKKNHHHTILQSFYGSTGSSDKSSQWRLDN